MNGNPQELIRKKRDGARLSTAEINSFVSGVASGAWADYQTSALLMACFINGLNGAEQSALTGAMLDSGERLDFSGSGAPVADKHSTGGVGDKTSLIIAPLVAACGVRVPMISGRGLGHTGGTLDKLESIEGYRVDLSLAEFRTVVETCGFSMNGQTAEIVPADKKLYALRDATATVESIPLIVASIMSKKLAEGLDALVLDVKTGSGAFMEKFEDARRLAEALVETGKSCGVRTEAVISDMNQPLGEYVGNALEVYECVKILRDEATDAMRETLELSIELAARMLVLCGVCGDVESSKLKIQTALDSGAALEKFRHNVELQGGGAKICDDPELLIDAGLKKTYLLATVESGSAYISAIDANAIGRAVSAIGGGRTKIGDPIDHAVGYQSLAKIGERVISDCPLGVLYYRTDEQLASIGLLIDAAYKLSEEKPAEPKLIKKIVA